MDYNSRPWMYEIVGLRFDGTEDRIETSNEEVAKYEYERFKKIFKTVLLCQSRKGVVKGQHE